MTRIRFFLAALLVGILTALSSSPLAESSQTVRVLLSRLHLSDRLELSLTTDYVCTDAKDCSLFLASGSGCTLLLEDNQLILYGDNFRTLLTPPVTLRHVSASGKVGFTVPPSEILYLGDVTLSVKENALRAVLQIDIEDYLLGLLPYEMGDSFPLEALKAQAVAARSYALACRGAYTDYDLTDTTSSQVFRGYTSGNSHCEQAAAETRGLCGYLSDQLIKCYYSASNGGMTERISGVWPDKEDLSCFQAREDPYDVENPSSAVCCYPLRKHYENGAPSALHTLLVNALQTSKQMQKLSTDSDCVRIDGISSCSLEQPAAKNSKIMTVLRITLLLSTRSKTISETGESIFSDYVPMKEPITLSLPVFPDAEDALSMNLNSGRNNEIWNVEETDDAFILTSRRYGHGVGLSQRGAEWMAKQYEKNYVEILSFYYPGMRLKACTTDDTDSSVLPELLLKTPEPLPTATPRPTAFPLTATPAPGQKLARVTEIDDDSSLNLRSTPSLYGTVLSRLYKNQELIVLERCEQEGWVHVIINQLEGYVKESFLTYLSK